MSLVDGTDTRLPGLNGVTTRRDAWSLGGTDHLSWGVASGEGREVGDVVAFDASQPAACLPEHVALNT